MFITLCPRSSELGEKMGNKDAWAEIETGEWGKNEEKNCINKNKVKCLESTFF